MGCCHSAQAYPSTEQYVAGGGYALEPGAAGAVMTAGVRWPIASLVAIGLLVYLWLLDPPVMVSWACFRC